MNSLPTEIRQMIVENLARVDYCFNEETGYYAGTLEHIVPLKSLRLACRAFASLVHEYLYRTVWVFPNNESLEKLKAIAASPFARHVRMLKIFWTLFDKDCLRNQEDYTEHVLSHYNCTKASLVRPSQRQLQNGWVHVNDLIGQNERLNETIETVLANTLPALTGLTDIEPGVAWEVLRNARAMQIETGTIQRLADSTFLTCSEKGWQQLLGFAVMHRLFRAMYQAGSRGQNLVLFNCGASVESTFLDFPHDMLDAARWVAQGLKEVRLRLETVQDGDLDHIIEKGLASRFIGWSLTVERLCLQTSPQNYIVDLSELLEPITLPKLKHLALFRITATADCLIAIIDRHQPTLAMLAGFGSCSLFRNTRTVDVDALGTSTEDISMADVTLIGGTWRQVFTSMQGERVLDYCHFEENYVLRGAFVNADEPLLIKGTNIEEDLNAYAFDGASWPSQSCAALEVEAFIT